MRACRPSWCMSCGRRMRAAGTGWPPSWSTRPGRMPSKTAWCSTTATHSPIRGRARGRVPSPPPSRSPNPSPNPGRNRPPMAGRETGAAREANLSATLPARALAPRRPSHPLVTQWAQRRSRLSSSPLPLWEPSAPLQLARPKETAAAEEPLPAAEPSSAAGTRRSTSCASIAGGCDGQHGSPMRRSPFAGVCADGRAPRSSPTRLAPPAKPAL